MIDELFITLSVSFFARTKLEDKYKTDSLHESIYILSLIDRIEFNSLEQVVIKLGDKPRRNGSKLVNLSLSLS